MYEPDETKAMKMRRVRHIAAYSMSALALVGLYLWWMESPWATTVVLAGLTIDAMYLAWEMRKENA